MKKKSTKKLKINNFEKKNLKIVKSWIQLLLDEKLFKGNKEEYDKHCENLTIYELDHRKILTEYLDQNPDCISFPFSFQYYPPNQNQSTMSNKMNYSDCLQLSRNYHVMLLTAVEKEGLFDHRDIVEKTFRKYEQMIDHLFKGNVLKEELDLLSSLPPWTNFDKEEGYKIYKKYKSLTHEEILA